VIFAHVGGVPVEEILPTLAGAGTGLLVARAWLAVRLRRRRGAPGVTVPARHEAGFESDRFSHEPAASPAVRLD
jgi:hypothetical protein